MNRRTSWGQPQASAILPAAEQAAEVTRLVSLGAQPVDWDSYPEDPDFVVLADTEGNLFCIIDLGHDG